MKKTINVEKFAIKEIRLVETKTKQENGTFETGWDALIQYAAEDADGKAHYGKVQRLSLSNNLIQPLITSLSTAIDTIEVNPSAINGKID